MQFRDLYPQSIRDLLRRLFALALAEVPQLLHAARFPDHNANRAKAQPPAVRRQRIARSFDANRYNRGRETLEQQTDARFEFLQLAAPGKSTLRKPDEVFSILQHDRAEGQTGAGGAAGFDRQL